MNTAYLMKYALTSGAIKLSLTDDEMIELDEKGHVYTRLNEVSYKSVYYKKDIAFSKDEAKKMFEARRIKKMVSLGKQVKKCSHMTLKFAD